MLLLVSLPPFAFLLLCCCFWGLLDRPLLLLHLYHVLPPPFPPLLHINKILLFLQNILMMPWSGASQLKQGLKIAVGTSNATDVQNE